MRFLRVICVLALVVGFATIASAETQNVKISGDLSMYSFWRQNYDLDKAGATEEGEAENFFASIAELQVDADLTDNVATCIRLVNQRDWDDDCLDSTSTTTEYKVEIDLAYVVLKEMLYSPLTLTVGRQDLWFGEGNIIGAKIRDPQVSYFTPKEYSATTAFDAIRATLDYDPWTIDLVYSKIEENTNTTNGQSGSGANLVSNNDDVDLYIVNVGYLFDSYNGEAEGYFVSLHDRSNMDGNEDHPGETYTTGVRGSFDPVEDATIKAEAAYQFGKFVYDGTNTERDREAFMLDISGEYRWPDARWTPVLGAQYILMSGEENDKSTDTQDWNGWSAPFCGHGLLAIRQWHNVFYDTDQRSGSNIGNLIMSPDQDSGLSNQHLILLSGSVAPTENLTIDALYGHVWFDEKVASASGATGDDDVGDEVDITLTYDYTEDVTFGLLAAWFFPGDVFPAGDDDTATDIVGSMKVSF